MGKTDPDTLQHAHDALKQVMERCLEEAIKDGLTLDDARDRAREMVKQSWVEDRRAKFRLIKNDKRP
jgi:hypothetical protein